MEVDDSARCAFACDEMGERLDAQGDPGEGLIECHCLSGSMDEAAVLTVDLIWSAVESEAGQDCCSSTD